MNAAAHFQHLRTLIIIPTVLLNSSCSPKIYPESILAKTSDTTIITEREYIRDTVIHLKPDTSLIRALIECDSVGRARLTEISTLRRSASLTQSLNLDDHGTLTATAAIDSMGIYLTYKERYRNTSTKSTSTSTETIIKEVNILHWWQKILIAIGAASMIGIALYTANQIKQFIK